MEKRSRSQRRVDEVKNEKIDQRSLWLLSAVGGDQGCLFPGVTLEVGVRVLTDKHKVVYRTKAKYGSYNSGGLAPLERLMEMPASKRDVALQALELTLGGRTILTSPFIGDFVAKAGYTAQIVLPEITVYVTRE